MLLPPRAWKETFANLGFVRNKKPGEKKAAKKRLSADRDARRSPAYGDDPLLGSNPASGGAHLGGSGTWNTTSSLWWNGTSDVAWSNTGGNTAVFSGAAGTATVSSGISAGEVDFSTTAYTLASGGLAISGSGTIDVASGLTDTISTAINGSAGLTKTDSGTLALTGTNTYTGTTAVNGGTLQLGGSVDAGQWHDDLRRQLRDTRSRWPVAQFVGGGTG